MSNKLFKIYAILVFGIIVLGSSFYFISREDNGLIEEQEKTLNIENIFSNKTEKSDKAINADEIVNLAKNYTNDKAKFSFSYPSNFIVNEFESEGNKKTLTIQNVKTGEGLQIYITPYEDSDFTVSAERIRRDLPDLPFSNSADVVVGSKAKGVAFFSENEAFKGQTAEVWFADGKIFFQATASAKDARLLEEIVKSWRFK